MNPARSAGVLVSAAVLLGGTLLAGDSALFNAGLARTDITPEQAVTMAGYASRKDLSQGVHDPLSARAVAFEHGSRRLVLVSTDILGFYNGTCEVIREAILSECSLRPEELLLSAIHTHAGPTPGLNSASAHPNNVSYPEGGYEARTSPFGPEAAGVVIAEVTRMLRELHGASSVVAGLKGGSSGLTPGSSSVR